MVMHVFKLWYFISLGKLERGVMLVPSGSYFSELAHFLPGGDGTSGDFQLFAMILDPCFSFINIQLFRKSRLYDPVLVSDENQ